MAVNLKYGGTLKGGRLDQITSKIGASGLFRIYDGTQPAGPDTAITSQNKLSENVMNATFAPAASTGTNSATLTANAIANATAGMSGTAAWFRMLNVTGPVAHIDGSAGTSSADLILDNTSINSGQTVAISSLVITAGN